MSSSPAGDDPDRPGHVEHPSDGDMDVDVNDDQVNDDQVNNDLDRDLDGLIEDLESGKQAPDDEEK